MPLTPTKDENEAPELAAASPREVRGLVELTERIILGAYRGHPWIPRALTIALGVLVATCLVAGVVRLSPLPLIPLPLFAGSAYALIRIKAARSAEADQALVVWTGLFTGATLAGFWLISMAGRWLG
ncbi:hypothetical protein [Amycolatopsis sp. BJA-103]|uniref:hypothetical protein n=1 Tax=unclassified Amycolatopsis TaxID=2618356 RepID=UPI000C7647C3|nr:hypothetical protein [Amycolatopsis sp. BJA-103]AUI57096.1 hypothetical protein BKN51_01995 [Amycolatopsis sp. BJA-103]PNE15373.1 hypothetical protein B1H26_30375 [Amycolatopsis sp. BJA-103]